MEPISHSHALAKKLQFFYFSLDGFNSSGVLFDLIYSHLDSNDVFSLNNSNERWNIE